MFESEEGFQVLFGYLLELYAKLVRMFRREGGFCLLSLAKKWWFAWSDVPKTM